MILTIIITDFCKYYHPIIIKYIITVIEMMVQYKATINRYGCTELKKKNSIVNFITSKLYINNGLPRLFFNKKRI